MMAPVRVRVKKFEERLTEEQRVAAKEKDKIRKREARAKMPLVQKKQASKLSAERLKKQRKLEKNC